MPHDLSAELDRATKRVKNAEKVLKNAKHEFEKASEELETLLDKHVKTKHGIHGGARRHRPTKRRHRRSRVTRKQK